jgi:hypothetical protein
MKTILARLALLLTLTAWVPQSSAVTVSVTPSAVSNTYSGIVTLQVTGLTNGETVLVQKFIDANGNGNLDSAETLWQSFKLTDGQATKFLDGAITVTNMNVPGDTDATAGQITALLNLSQSGFEQTIAGKYLYVVTSPFGNFPPLTNSFAVTNFSFGQALTGSVIASGTNVPGAAVLLFQPVGNNFNPAGGAVVDNSGNYQISAPPGDYVLMPFKSNFVADTGAALVTLANGVNLSSNLFLLPANRSISGSFIDASNAAIGLPGVLIPVESENGLLTVAFTDANGNFNAGVTSDQWKVEISDQGAALLNYLRPQNKVHVDTSTGSVSGITITLPKANALFYGKVKDGSNQPVAGTSIFSGDSQNYGQNVNSAADGAYFSGAYGDGTTPWQLQTSQDGNPANYIFSSPAFDYNQNGGTNLQVGQALHVDFTALIATNHITGRVQNQNSNAIANVRVMASATINGANFQTQADTDGSGNYSLNVANGTWSVNVSCSGGDGSLDNVLGSGTYQCPAGQSVVISNNDTNANFTVLPCGGIQVLTSSPLAPGQVGIYYSNQLSAASCSGNFNWSLDSGSLPPGITLYSPGALNGTATNSGTFVFTVHVVDGNSIATNQNFSLTINPYATPPTLGQMSKSGTHFQFAVSGLAGQYYTIQTSTNLKSTNWTSLLVTNPPVNTFIISDTNATNPMRFYRALLGQ